MSRRRLCAAIAGVGGIGAFAAVLIACAQVPASSAPSAAPPAPPAPVASLDAATVARVMRNPPLGAVPADPTNRYADNADAAKLGHLIFFDPRFSASGAVSCSTCHDPAHGFADARTLAIGTGTGTRHAMSVLNTAYNRWFTWDGRADTLWSQALQPFETAHEQDFPRTRVMKQVMNDAQLAALFTSAFGQPPAATDQDFARVGKALAAYERKLVTGPSAYDRWWTRRAANDARADEELSASARRGLAIFFGKGNCWQCHHGSNFTDGEFHLIGAPPLDKGGLQDAGRYAVVEGVRDDPFNAAGHCSDDPACAQARISAALRRTPDAWGQFKTPSLRNVSTTPPYMHQGQFPTLQSVVHFYSTLEGATALDHHREQVLSKLNLSAQEELDLVEFMKALEGTPPPAPWGKAPVSTQPAKTDSVRPNP